MRFVSSAWRSGDSDMEYLIATGRADLMDDICGQLNEMCLDRLAQITIKDIDKKIFSDH